MSMTLFSLHFFKHKRTDVWYNSHNIIVCVGTSGNTSKGCNKSSVIGQDKLISSTTIETA